jgi:folate-dependent phosphoribosylglycinamide formyltransferase PurN
MSKKVIKLNGKDVKMLVDQIIKESKDKKASKPVVSEEKKKPVNPVVKENKKPTPVINRNGKKVIRLTESEMIEFLDKVATRVENSRLRRGK